MERITMNIPVLALRGLTAFPSQTLYMDNITPPEQGR